MSALVWIRQRSDDTPALTRVRLVEGEACPRGHVVEDVTCAYCGAVRYRGSMCEHVAQPLVIRRRWDNLPLCLDCLRIAPH